MRSLGGRLRTRETQHDDERLDPTMKFKIVTASGGYRAKIVGGNGEPMFISEVYTTKQSAQHACQVVKANAASAPIVDET